MLVRLGHDRRPRTQPWSGSTHRQNEAESASLVAVCGWSLIGLTNQPVGSGISWNGGAVLVWCCVSCDRDHRRRHPHNALPKNSDDRNLRHRRRFTRETNCQAPQMNKSCSNEKGHSKQGARRPVVAAIAVAIFGVAAMLVVDHGPWNRPRVQPAEVATYKTTGEAARAAGATVTPTEPKPTIEPVTPGPKPVNPANIAAAPP